MEAVMEAVKKSEVVKLYDIEKHNYPSNRGDVFRSLQVFECGICKAMTNEVVMGGSMSYGVRTVCPNSSECWHHELEDKVELLKQPHPKMYKDALKKEIDQIRKKNKSKIKNDIKGEPDLKLKDEVTNTWSFDPDNKKCTHY